MESLTCEYIRETQTGRTILCSRTANRRVTYINQDSALEFTENRCSRHTINQNADTVRSESI